MDDHPMVLEGMNNILSQMNFVEIIGLANHPYKAMYIINTLIPDMILTDINMPEINGIEFTAKIKKEYPEIKVIAMSSYSERSYISQMLQNGASGYILKNSSAEEIEDAILSVISGEQYLSETLQLNRQEEQEMDKIPLMSSREKDVLLLVAEGLTTAQIAEKLFISSHTVDSHRKNLLTKLGVANTAGLIKLATKYGLL